MAQSDIINIEIGVAMKPLMFNFKPFKILGGFKFRDG